jgi:hypothetical protein
MCRGSACPTTFWSVVKLKSPDFNWAWIETWPSASAYVSTAPSMSPRGGPDGVSVQTTAPPHPLSKKAKTTTAIFRTADIERPRHATPHFLGLQHPCHPSGHPTLSYFSVQGSRLYITQYSTGVAPRSQVLRARPHAKKNRRIIDFGTAGRLSAFLNSYRRHPTWPAQHHASGAPCASECIAASCARSRLCTTRQNRAA